MSKPRAANPKPKLPRGKRPPGSLNSRTAKLIDRALATGVTPLDVMLDNMRFWYSKAQHIAESLEETVLSLDDPESIDGLMDVLRDMKRYREHAQDCAVDAAPYIHNKLASITVKAGTGHPLEKITHDMDVKQAADSYADTLAG